jgi:predicted lipoprotein with Yx(FWY)xxD motif
MRSLPTLVSAAVAASLLIAGCGGGSSSPPGAAASSDTVSVKQVDGVGAVLVDASGKALYTPDQDTARHVRCTGGCVAFWQPLEPGAGKPTALHGGPALAVIRRPDGTRQVTAAGRPLYTFSQDSAGAVTGDGFMDKFGGRSFLWHVVHAGKGVTATSTPAASPRPSSGYGY